MDRHGPRAFGEDFCKLGNRRPLRHCRIRRKAFPSNRPLPFRCRGVRLRRRPNLVQVRCHRMGRTRLLGRPKNATLLSDSPRQLLRPHVPHRESPSRCVCPAAIPNLIGWDRVVAKRRVRARRCSRKQGERGCGSGRRRMGPAGWLAPVFDQFARWTTDIAA
jgi:hypothetical protein